MATLISNRQYVALSEALSWIAFGDLADSVAHWQNYTDAKQRLEQALTDLLTAATSGTIRLRGKLVPNANADPVAINTDEIPATRFHDFRQYDQSCCGLRAGTGLFGFGEEAAGSFDYFYQPLGRQDFYRDVLVCRDDLISVFPAPFGGRKVSHAEVVQWCRDWIAGGRGNDGNKAWKEFSALPEFEGCSREDVFRPAWLEAKTKA